MKKKPFKIDINVFLGDPFQKDPDKMTVDEKFV